MAKQKSAKDKSFGKLSLDEKVLILFLKSKKLEEFHVSTNREAFWFQFLKKNKFTPVLKNFSVERRIKLNMRSSVCKIRKTKLKRHLNT